MKHFYPFASFDVSQIQFALGTDRNGKPTISMTVAPAGGEVAMVTAPAVTQWPRVSGDGNYGTMWGPSDPAKAKFTLDLTDAPINDQPNVSFEAFMRTMEAIDDKLLDFVVENQHRILGRKNLQRHEVKMLQVRSVRTKHDKVSGSETGHVIDLKTPKFAWASGSRRERPIVVCDHSGATVPNAEVCGGDVVAATMYANQVYTGVGGDKFGISWAFQEVTVICQSSRLAPKAQVNAFQGMEWDFAQPYVAPVSDLPPNESPTEVYAQFGTAPA